ncbi:MAG: hypothetical protein RLZZ338_4631 [Cyanobacteriota bacterium]|jgi:hypothetical protein
MTWKSYELDQKAQELVLKHRDRDKKNVLNESHKMREAVAYGLERFWGEHLRYKSNGQRDKAEYWEDTWKAFVSIMKDAGINQIPEGSVDHQKTKEIQKVANDLWEFSKKYPDEQRVALAVLTQFCDCIVWWTQRYKPQKTKKL